MSWIVIKCYTHNDHLTIVFDLKNKPSGRRPARPRMKRNSGWYTKTSVEPVHRFVVVPWRCIDLRLSDAEMLQPPSGSIVNGLIFISVSSDRANCCNITTNDEICSEDGIPNKALKLAFKPIPGLFVEFVQTLLVDSDLTDRKHSCDTDNRLREYIISVNRGAHGSGTERH